jgi:cytochrome c556
MTAHRLLALFAGVFAFAAVTSSCAAPKQAPPPPPAAQQLWGDMKPIVSVKELMRDMIDPASDYIFDAIGETDTKQGTVVREPKTDQDWEKIRIGAVTLAEGVYLLKIPRPFAPAGDENNSTGPEPEELSPAQIRAKLEADPALWNAKIEALRNVGLQVLEIVKRKDAKELWDAAENLDDACETCHLAFWYPGEKAYLRKLDQHLQDLAGQRGQPK